MKYTINSTTKIKQTAKDSVGATIVKTSEVKRPIHLLLADKVTGAQLKEKIASELNFPEKALINEVKLISPLSKVVEDSTLVELNNLRYEVTLVMPEAKDLVEAEALASAQKAEAVLKRLSTKAPATPTEPAQPAA